MVRRRLVVAWFAAVACGPADKAPGSAQRAQDTVAAVASTPPEPEAPGACRKTGDWQLCSVEDRLTRAGFVIEALTEPASRSFFSVRGTTFRVGAGDDRVEVFIYSSAEARLAETGRLDSAAVSPKGEQVNYRVPPMLITSRNLAAIAFTYNERQRERLDLALSAGLPAK